MLAFCFLLFHFVPCSIFCSRIFFEGVCLENGEHLCVVMCAVCFQCLWFVDNLCVGGGGRGGEVGSWFNRPHLASSGYLISLDLIQLSFPPPSPFPSSPSFTLSFSDDLAIQPFSYCFPCFFCCVLLPWELEIFLPISKSLSGLPAHFMTVLITLSGTTGMQDTSITVTRGSAGAGKEDHTLMKAKLSQRFAKFLVYPCGCL